ncbi:MAG TPA: IPT/TIG domain-containing protein [Bryobacteraceae bacterium]|nr:IPT/TIG domain-containing protein [Bryobacteraceae bacterium]
MHRTSDCVCLHHIFEFFFWSFCLSSSLWAQGGSGTPVRWQAQYTQIYSDDIETVAPTLGSAFSLGPAGSLTSNQGEVIAGGESIKGSYFGSASNTAFLSTNPSVLPFTPNHSYTVTFQYKILTPPSNYFVVQFFSATAASQANFLKAVPIVGTSGATGNITLTSTLANYSDYQVLWNIGSTGAISIDNIQITDATGKVIAFENGEKTAPTLKSGIQLQGATVTTDPSRVISGKASLLLNNPGGFITDPFVIPIGANTIYTIKFDYRIISPGTADTLFYLWFQPTGTTDQASQVVIPTMLKNSEVTGTFSTGAQTAGRSAYVLHLGIAAAVSLVIDNIFVYRQDVTAQSAPPPSWNYLATAPFPRLGNYILEGTHEMAQFGWDERPFTYTVAQIESRLAFADVIAGLSIHNQTLDPDSIHRIRTLNPNAVILPQRMLEGQQITTPPFGSNIDLDYQLVKSTPDEWKSADTSGNVIGPVNFPDLFYMNISDLVPVVNGQTWRTALPNFLNTQIFPSGVWDGVWFHFMEDALNPDFPHNDDPALFNYDWNRNGLRDETPASTSEMIRAAKAKMLQQINLDTNGSQLIMGNAGGAPQFALAPFVNGYTFECFNSWWNQPGAPIASSSPASWRVEFDSYLRMQTLLRAPQLNIMQACGINASDFNTENFSNAYLTPTSQDLQQHRLSMGTALLGNGFYEYSLKDSLSAPYWFDEYSVDSTGNAIEDRTKKGYLGQPLADASELANPGTLVFQEGFESGVLPNSFIGNPSTAVSITQAAGEFISGGGSLVLSNPDHTKQGTVSVRTNPAVIPLSAGVTYLLIFDWRILETIDCAQSGFRIGVNNGSQSLDHALVPGTVAGDSGTLHFPFTIPSAGNWSINFFLTNGGGKVAIDNVKIYQGGVGPWRRDFENGFVLINPFAQPHTFSVTDLAGALNRTGIHRIKGAQAPDINNGQAVSDSLTLAPFDAIILLADPIHLSAPVITSVANAAGGQHGVASGAFVSIYGSNFTPLPYDDWSKAIINGQLPKQLDTVSVTIGGKPAYIYAISPGQINVQAPDVGNGPVQVVVTTGGGASTPFTTSSLLYSPAFFPWPGNQPVATHADYSIAAKNDTFPGVTTVAAKPGEVITLWGTGFGPTNPLVPAGQEPTAVAPPTQSPVTVTLGGTAIPVLGAVLSSYAAAYQIAIQIPASMPDGDYPIVATLNGAQSPSSSVLTVQHTQ